MICKIITTALLSAISAHALVDVDAEITRAADLSRKAASLVTRNTLHSHWSEGDAALVYSINADAGQTDFILVDLRSGGKSPAFDHDALAGALSEASGRKIAPSQLPLKGITIGADGTLSFRALDKSWIWSPKDKTLVADDRPPAIASLNSPEKSKRGTRLTGESTQLTVENATGGEIGIFWVNAARERTSYGKVPPGATRKISSHAGHLWLFENADGTPLASLETPEVPSIARITGRIPAEKEQARDVSPDGKWRAHIKDHNVWVGATDGGPAKMLSQDGVAGDPYSPPFQWSPDSLKLVAFRAKVVKERRITIVQSSPPDQAQPKVLSIPYAKPGDAIHQLKPRLFSVADGRQIPLADGLYPNPWKISELHWAADSSEFTFAYNQRGHQLMRVVAIRADTGDTRTIIEDRSDTFIDYSQKFHLHHFPATREILWASERSGYNHLYLIDAVTGSVKNPVTAGPWNVREVVEVDESGRRLLLKVVGLPGQDPYHEHFIRVPLDGGGMTRLTEGDGTHRIEFSPGGKYFVDTWSRVDLPPVTELREASTGKLITELEQADDSALERETGRKRPQRFTTMGRDGKTPIHGVIILPTRFDPAKKYPVLEDIYAGPHDHFVPKSYAPWRSMNSMAELGFIVVKIDGMGTNWRSKAFHDHAWKNLMDAGFPDRIRWIKEAAATRPWMDTGRVGIYGGSAGGQSTLAGLLHHGEFYKAGVADCGCHDNRMDKIWWNEAWMGWPMDESYGRNSNVTHAAKLSGKLMLIVGEIDDNVDPASTSQVVAALQEAGKDFDHVQIMNAGHGAAETPYGNRRRAAFLVEALGAMP